MNNSKNCGMILLKRLRLTEPIELAKQEAIRTHIAEQYGYALSLMNLFWRSSMDAVNWGSETLSEHCEASRV